MPEPGLPLPAAVLWDLDGTLVDTEPAWITAETELAARFGVVWTEEDGELLIGSALPAAGAIIRSKGIDMEPDAIVDDLIGRVLQFLDRGVPWQPGAFDVLAMLRDAGVPCALVTMSYRDMADRIVAGAPEGVFGAVVAGDEVTHGKPHPEPYLHAAELLGVDIARCVALEDSPTGLASAEAAGANVVGIERLVPVLEARGRSRISTLEGLTLDDFARLAAGQVIDRLVALD